MKSKKDIFVDYKTSLSLKELKFDEICIAKQYSEQDVMELSTSCWNSAFTELPNAVALPTWDQVIEWLCDEHNIVIGYHLDLPYGYQFHLLFRGLSNRKITYFEDMYETKKYDYMERYFPTRKDMLVWVFNELFENYIKSYARSSE